MCVLRSVFLCLISEFLWSEHAPLPTHTTTPALWGADESWYVWFSVRPLVSTCCPFRPVKEEDDLILWQLWYNHKSALPVRISPWKNEWTGVRWMCVSGLSIRGEGFWTEGFCEHVDRDTNSVRRGRESVGVSLRGWDGTGVKEAGGRPAVHQPNPQTAVHFSKPPCAPLQASILPLSPPIFTPLVLHPHPLPKPTVSVSRPSSRPSLLTLLRLAYFDRVPRAGQGTQLYGSPFRYINSTFAVIECIPPPGSNVPGLIQSNLIQCQTW